MTFLSYDVSTPAAGPIRPLIQWVSGDISPEVKRPGSETAHSPQVKNARC